MFDLERKQLYLELRAGIKPSHLRSSCVQAPRRARHEWSPVTDAWTCFHSDEVVLFYEIVGGIPWNSSSGPAGVQVDGTQIVEVLILEFDSAGAKCPTWGKMPNHPNLRIWSGDSKSRDVES